MREKSIEELANASEEKFVEGIYRSEISRLRACNWVTPDINASVDGYTEWKNTRFLLEAKLDENLKSRRDACNVLAQAVFYLRRFMDAGKPPPTVVMIADKNECFIVATSVLEKHTKMDINWKGAASKGNAQLSAALMKDQELKFFVHPVMQGFNLEEVLSHADAISTGQSFTITITPANISRVYQVWKEEGIVVDKIPGPLGSIMLFFEVIERGIQDIPRAGEKVSVGKFGEITVKTLQLELFQATYRTGYGYTESVALLAKRDQLMEDEARRFQGAFYTPEIWRDHAIEEITRVLGENWMQDCVVWDPAAGTGNLTRDRKWGCLISSTAEKADVDVMQRFGWGGTVFQYDFLNPDAESPFFEDGELSVIPPKVDKLLRAQAAAGKRLVWFMNPPYAEHSIAGTSSESKGGVAKTSVNSAMLGAKMGLPSRQLYAQFMFQCRKVAEQYGFKDYTVALFSMHKFMTSGSYRSFRDWWYGTHKYESGFLFQASHFADVSGAWGVSFTVWSAGSGGKTDPRATQPIRLCDERNFAVVTDGTKQIYNADGREASDWVRAPIKGLKGVDAPQMTSGLKFNADGDKKFVPGGLFNMNNHSNSLMKSATDVFFTSVCSTSNAGVSVLPSNWRRAVALYGARKLVADHWAIHEDEYLAPDESKPGYDQWVNDCHVYALLDTKNNCTAMRDVQYKDKAWQIHNHWFWRTHQSVDALLRQRVSTKRLSRDAAIHTNEPYFARLLHEGLELSEDAQHVLDYVNALWLLSLDDRESYAVQHPELHLMAWDAGIYQLKHLWRDYYSEKWEELRKAHKSLAERLQEGVYEYGFLKK
jgi:hypothetical protein